MPFPQISLAVVGADYSNKRGPTRRFEIELIEAGEPVDLVPEPKNPADPQAIAVHSCRGVRIGYIRAERAPFIQKMLREGHDVRAVFQAKARAGAVIRVAFDEDPVLPAAGGDDRADESDNTGFWPDPEWPDE